MIRCEVTGKLVQTKFIPKKIKTEDGETRTVKIPDITTLPYVIVTEIREKEYNYVKVEGRGTFRADSDQGRSLLGRVGGKDKVETFTTKGFEIVKTKRVCYEVYKKHVENGGLVC